MFKNHLKLAFRSLWKRKEISLINILGLSLGIATSLLVLLWVTQERSFDQFHANAEQIYQVMVNLEFSSGNIETWDDCPAPYGRVLQANLPEVEAMAMLGESEEHVVESGDRRFKEKGSFANAGFFQLFSFPLLAGEASQLLATPNQVAISEKLAAKLFGDASQNPEQLLGREVEIDKQAVFQVAGVFQIPANSSLQFDYLLPVEFLFTYEPEQRDHWGNYIYHTFLRLKEQTDVPALNEKLAKVIQANNPGNNSPNELFLHPLTQRHLYSNFENGQLAGGRIEYIRLFLIAALFVLLVACLNFMNLMTARSSRRAREVGVRKVVGASRSSLIGQFMTESILLTVIAAALALQLGHLVLPSFNALTGNPIQIAYDQKLFWGLLLSVVLLTGLISGGYPALMLSSFRAINVLKGKLSNRLSATNVRRGLVVVQFMLSILLIIGAFIVRDQINFIRNKDIGLDRHNLISLKLDSEDAQAKVATFKEELLKNSGIKAVTVAGQDPLSIGSATGDVRWEGQADDEGALFHLLWTDEDFLSTMAIPLAEGRDFIAEREQKQWRFIINEEAARVMGMEEPLGKKLSFWDEEGPIIGVVKDFHFASLHIPVEPLVMWRKPEWASQIMIRPQQGQTDEALATIEEVWKTTLPGYDFEYQFMDDRYETMYRNEQVTGRLADVFGLLAILISCLGLLALAAFTAERKTKEIGIRKVLGASVAHIIFMLNKEFGRLILIAFLISVPLAWYLLNQWLAQFAYRVDFGVKSILLALAVIVATALLTVSFHSFRAARRNPTEALKYE